MMVILIACLGALSIISQSDASCKLPKFVTRCKRNDPDLAKCWRSIIEAVPHHLAKGIPECRVPPIDPWRTPHILSIYETCTVHHRNIEERGTKHFEVIDNTISPDITHITLKLRFPQLYYTCSPTVKGICFNFTLPGRQGCNEAIGDVMIRYVFEGQSISKKGKEYIAFNNITVDVDGTYTEQKFYDLVSGGDAENEKFNLIAEKDPDILRPFLNGFIKQTMGDSFASAIQYVYEHYPLDTIHPMK